MASSSSTSEEPPSSSIVANAPPSVSTEASGNQTSTTNPPSPRPLMDHGLLEVACSGSWKKLQSFLSGNPHQPSSDGDSSDGDIQQPSRDEEALLRVSLLEGFSVEGDTFLHLMATNSVEESLIEDGLGLIRSKAVPLLLTQNKQGDTALHCAARAESDQMVMFLVDLARGKDDATVKALLETENNSGRTVLHEAVSVGSYEMVKFLMKASGNQTSTTKKHSSGCLSWKGSPLKVTTADGQSCMSQWSLMDHGLLAVACSGSWKKLESFLSGGDDEEALLRVSFLEGFSVEWDTFLHLMAANSLEESPIEDTYIWGLIRSKAVPLLLTQNKQGDTALHCAARAKRHQMMRSLVDLARGKDAATVKALLETENNSGWTVLHEAISVGSNEMVDFLMKEEPLLARSPKDGTSPMYLAILLRRAKIAQTLHNTDVGLSYSGPKGQNALHAAVLRNKVFTEMLLGWNNTTLTMQQDDNGSTPLHLAASDRYRRDRRPIRLLLLEANPNALYQPDDKGLFPIHVAASVGAVDAVRDYIRNSPHCACLRDTKKGRTFLHVAAQERKMWVVYTCMNRSLSWILNMQDNDGNTALHLAVQAESLAVCCALLGNRHVNLNIPNGKGESPLDVARLHRSKGNMNLSQNSEVRIYSLLQHARAESGICRLDYFPENNILRKTMDEKLELEKLKESTQNLSIVSVLIATVTFGATFAMPGGYRADDHTNGGTPTLAGRYDFDAFTMANTLAFTFSAIATVGLMSSGSPLHNTRIRLLHFYVAFHCMKYAIKCLVAAFAIGAYTMLAPVAHKTAVAICVLSSLVLLYQKLEFIIKTILMIAPRWVRREKISTFIWFMTSIVGNILVEYWPIIVIFLSTLRSHTGKVESAIQPPTPSP